MGNVPHNFSQEFPTRFSHKIFLQDFPARISHKVFPQHFPATISCNNFPQQFPARISHKNFPQDFPELDPDWLAPHHPIPNAKFPPITAFLKLAFSPPPFPARISHKIFPQDFPTRFSHKIFLSWILIGWLPITLFQMLNFHQSLPFLNWLFPPPPFPARISHKIFPQDFPTRFSHKIFLSWILIGWLPITLFQMLNFHQSLPFLNWLFPLLHFLQEFPARFSRKNFPQDFPELDPDWLAPYHPIPNAKFPPITSLLNRPTYHKRSKVSPPPFPQILWEPQINE